MSAEQMALLERLPETLMRKKVGNLLKTRLPSGAGIPAAALDHAASRAIAAARAVRLLDGMDILRFCDLLFRIHATADEQRMARFTRVMLTEQTGKARLNFVEQHLLPMPS